jgi:hypothetical protein
VSGIRFEVLIQGNSRESVENHWGHEAEAGVHQVDMNWIPTFERDEDVGTIVILEEYATIIGAFHFSIPDFVRHAP